MMKEYFLPPKVFDEILAYAKKENLHELEKLVNKHDNGTIFVDPWEIEMLTRLHGRCHTEGHGTVVDCEAGEPGSAWNGSQPRPAPCSSLEIEAVAHL